MWTHVWINHPCFSVLQFLCHFTVLSPLEWILWLIPQKSSYYSALLLFIYALDRHIYNSQRQSLCLYIWFLMLSNNSAHSQHDDFFGSFSTKFPKVLHRKLWYLHWILQSLTTEDLGAILSILMIPKSLLQTQPGSAFFACFFFSIKGLGKCQCLITSL